METLNMLSGGDIYQFPYDDIKILFINHCRDARKKGRASQILVSSSLSTTTIKHFMREMLHTFSLQMDSMQIKRKQEEA